jgi:hypothetical protein
MRKLNMIGWLAVLVVAIVLVIQVIPVERNVSTVPPGQSFEKTEKVPPTWLQSLKFPAMTVIQIIPVIPGIRYYSRARGSWPSILKKAKKNSILMSSITIQKDVKKQK